MANGLQVQLSDPPLTSFYVAPTTPGIVAAASEQFALLSVTACSTVHWPLCVWARFATVPFSLDERQLSDRFVHLTNSSVQKERVDKGLVPAFLKDGSGA